MSFEMCMSLCFLIIGVFMIAIVVFLITIITESKKENAKWEQYKLNIETLNTACVEDIQKMLDKLIDECLTDYLASNPEYINAEYITDKMELQMRTQIGDLISARLSEALYDKLALYYNKLTIPSIIADKIYLKVTAYVIKINSKS